MMNRLMKKIAVAIAAATMAIASLTTIASANETKYVANDIGLSVRVAPDRSADRFGGVYQGQAVDVIGLYDNEWAMINYGGNVGYVIAGCLVSSMDEVQTSVPTYNTTGKVDAYGFKADSNVATKSNYTVSVAAGTYLTLRNAPTSDGSAEIGQLHNGDTVCVIEGNGEFWMVDAPSVGRVGYVNSNYLY